MEAFTYKGIAEGKYVEGEIEALNQDEASHKLKEQKVIITNLVRTKKKTEGIAQSISEKQKGKEDKCTCVGHIFFVVLSLHIAESKGRLEINNNM